MFGRNRLIDLDCIIDTRIGVLYNNYPEVLKKIEYDKYIDRDNELMFIELGAKDWYDVYAKRSINDLKVSPCTNLVNVIITTMYKDQLEHDLGSPTDKPKLAINCYPYKFNDDVAEEFTYTFEEIFKNLNVCMVYYSPNDLPLNFLTAKYDSYVTYDLLSWMETNANTKSFSKRANNFVLEAPTLLNKLVTRNDIHKFKAANKNPFHETRLFLAEILDCSFIDTVGFCAMEKLFNNIKKTIQN